MEQLMSQFLGALKKEDAPLQSQQDDANLRLLQSLMRSARESDLGSQGRTQQRKLEQDFAAVRCLVCL